MCNLFLLYAALSEYISNEQLSIPHSYVLVALVSFKHHVLRINHAIKSHKYVSGLADFMDFRLLALNGPAHPEN
jgi:hypothetical protein